MPDWRYAIERRLEGLRLSPAREAEVVEELAQHLDDRYAEHVSAGASEERARREALAELDGADLVRELTGIDRPPSEPIALGGGSPDRLVAGLWQDVRYGARLIAREPGIAVVIVATLALAIAANTIVFGLTDLLLLRPLPISNTARLVTVFSLNAQHGQDRQLVSVPDFVDIRAQTGSFEDLSAMSRDQMSLTGGGDALVVRAAFVTANHFRVWDVPAFSGRLFQADEDRSPRNQVAVLSHRFWTARFSSAPPVIDRSLTLNGRPYTVIGVLTPTIEIGNIGEIDVWLPLDTRDRPRRADLSLTVFGLLKPQATLDGAKAELATIAERLRKSYPGTNEGRQLHAISLRD